MPDARSELPLANRSAVVTGAARGIGRGIARLLAQRGARVVLADREGGDSPLTYELAGRAELEASAQALRDAGAEALAVTADVTRKDDLERLVQRTLEAFGGLDLLVNNAGVVHFAPFDEIDEERWDHVYAVNVKGIYLATQAALPALTRAKGSVVNIASVAGKRGHAFGSLYCSSKFAVVGLTQSLAQELGPRGVRVNAVCPGILATHMWTHHLSSEARGGAQAYAAQVERAIPLGRDQSPEDVAEAVLYLATAENVTGVSLNVAGGMEMA